MKQFKLPVFLLLTLIFGISISAGAQDYQIDWADTVDFGSSDYAHGLAIDRKGMVFVTGGVYGTTDFNVFTVKYDTAGNIIRADTLDNGSHDYGRGVAVDSDNNLILLASSVITGTDYDCQTLKYDSLGNWLWSQMVDNGDNDYVYDIAVDSKDNIIITGYSEFATYDCHTVKYSPSGSVIWIDTLDNGLGDYLQSVAVDNSDNIIVTGYSIIGGNRDYYTVKYDTSSTILWIDTLDSGDEDYAYGVATDNDNNVIVTGRAFINSDYDYLTVKYDSLGNILWMDTVDNGSNDWAKEVATDRIGNIFVTGQSDMGNNDIFTVKYSPDGVILWADTIDNGYGDQPEEIAIDNEGNILITGSSSIGGNDDYYTVRYLNLCGIDEVIDINSGIDLKKISPNSSCGILDVRYSIRNGQRIRIEIFDVTGRPVELLYDGFRGPGTYSLKTEISKQPGVYFLGISSSRERSVRKFVLMK